MSWSVWLLDEGAGSALELGGPAMSGFPLEALLDGEECGAEVSRRLGRPDAGLASRACAFAEAAGWRVRAAEGHELPDGFRLLR